MLLERCRLGGRDRALTFPADDPRHAAFEAAWWGDCTLTWSEEWKQQVYLHRMGVVQTSLGEQWPVYRVAAQSVIDIGGGPVSPLLKTLGVRRGVVVDPGIYPDWTIARYTGSGIEVVRAAAEVTLPLYGDDEFDEAWIMNCLQHVIDPEKIAVEAARIAKLVRVFEWVGHGVSLGHPHTLNSEDLDRWLGGHGTVEQINEHGCVGTCYSGVFTTEA